MSNNKVNNSEKCKKRIELLGGKITEFTMIQSRTNTTDNILKAVNIKLQKLNGNNYKRFKNNYLLIRDSIFIPNEFIKILQYTIAMIQSKYDIEFDIIYILLNRKLIELNMIDYTNRHFDFSSNMQWKLAEKARNIAVEYEEKNNE